MSNKFAREDTVLRVTPAPARHHDHSLDSKLGPASQPARRERLACHWRAGGDGGLKAHWQIEPAHQSSATNQGTVRPLDLRAGSGSIN